MSVVRREERGAATVITIAFLGLLVLVGAALSVVGAMVAAHREAQSAADLAALAGASTLADGGADGGDPCAAAATVASANGAVLVDCVVVDLDVRTTVVVTGPRWLGQTGDLAAEARAGPAS